LTIFAAFKERTNLNMTVPENKLVVKRSALPGSGKGLFTKVFIPKGTKIVEYKGTITTWKEVDHTAGENGYIYYVKRNYVINAQPHKDAIARYANDAKGLIRVKGISNNAEYKEDGLKVFIVAKKDIPAGAEILVDYGKEYWEVIRYNQRIDKKRRAGSRNPSDRSHK
jgi:SET domain-containing protein